MIYTSLSLVNPRRFVWIGPDPPHHFSIAIVPQAIPYLFRALSEHTNLTELKLTHINMSSVHTSIRLPVIPSLRSLYLGQAIFLHPFVVASLILDPSLSLEKVHLVDAYRGSIWGLRLRRSDIESYATGFPSQTDFDPGQLGNTSTEMYHHNLSIIRRIVVCEARTERIMGGDRVEENAILI
ncbi:hypothetical protein JR316_0004302 [Psilocybe cubensis]|uniref:Uncharacterized protein n=2 Tax=Psilocybe cubensis TaxID=181762 RepID=A0A8H7XXT1_PSICU|nr:hypothetical protein JR316_0004302 [Psilocybe cubensis]KAH9482207.1 hypothetical protein JR316_0004302 [Psilocybe cubensis]